jgi:hypothetical protein
MALWTRVGTGGRPIRRPTATALACPARMAWVSLARRYARTMSSTTGVEVAGFDVVKMQSGAAIPKDAEDFEQVRHCAPRQVASVGDNNPIDGIEAGDQTVPASIFATTGDPSVILESGHHHIAAIFDCPPKVCYEFCWSCKRCGDHTLFLVRGI